MVVSPMCKLFFSKSHHEDDLLSYAHSIRSQQQIVQAGMAVGGNVSLSRHEANPAVVAAVDKGSLKAAYSLASTPKRYDWMTPATTSGNDSSHGTVSRISWPATA